MDLEKIGKFIKKLRNDNKLTQEGLVNELDKFNVSITIDAVSQWEHGKTIPTIDNLMALSEYFKVTIDEILDGEKYEEQNLEEKYFVYKKGWYEDYDSNDIYGLLQDQKLLIKNNMERLLRKRVKEQYTKAEEKEFRFLFENFYELTDYYEDYLNNSKAITKSNKYIILNNVINICLSKIRDMDDDEKVWEIRKFIIPQKEYDFNFSDICDDNPINNKWVDKRFKNLDFWEKDIILTTIQNCDPMHSKETDFNFISLKSYNERNGNSYNYNDIVKDIIKYLINNGACINKHYLNLIKIKKEEKRIIDELEYYYNLCKKPLKVETGFVDNIKYYNVENTLRNRFFCNYLFELNYIFKNIPDEEAFKIFMENDKFPKDILIEKVKEYNKKQDYKDSPISIIPEYIEDKWNEFKDQEKEIEIGLTEIPKLEKRLIEGEKYYQVISKEEIGGKSYEEIRDYCYYWNQFVTYNELLNSREIDKTKELLDNIDKLSIEEIREKYFVKEEYDEDE